MKSRNSDIPGWSILIQQKKLANSWGAEGILLGSVNDMGNSITINARLVDIESGNTLHAAETELPKTPLIVQLLDIPVEDKSSTVKIISTNTPPQERHKRGTPFYEKDMFRIDVVSFQREGGSIELKLKYFNRTKKVIKMLLSNAEKNI